MSSVRYSVILRGEHRFSLSKAQIQRDSPESNFFVCCFLRDFKEGETREVDLDQDPKLFATIVQHMSGYRILPLSSASLPPGMTHEVAMENLARDAQFFGLDGLYLLLTSPALPLAGPHFIMWNGLTTTIVDFEDVVNGRLPSGITCTTLGLFSNSGAGPPDRVLVYGRNMNLRSKLQRNYSELSPPEHHPMTFSLSVDISESKLQSLIRQNKAWANSLTSILESKTNVLPAHYSRHQDSAIHINGRKTFFVNLRLWLNHLKISPEDRVQKPRYHDIRVFDDTFPGILLKKGEEAEFTFWMDEAFFLIHAKTGNRPFSLELLEVITRTRSAILGASFPPVRPQTDVIVS